MSTDPLYIHRTAGKWHGAALRAMMDTLPDGQYAVTIKAMGRKSVKQNAYLHVLFTIAAKMMNAEGLGDGKQWTMERVKDLCKREQLYPVVDMVLPGGEVMQMSKGTRELTMSEAAETIERVIAFFAEFGLHLPAPGEQVALEIAA